MKKSNKRPTIKNSNDQQNTSSSSYKIRSRNTVNKITSTNIRLLMFNEVNNRQEVGLFILTYLISEGGRHLLSTQEYFCFYYS